ncbi:rhamnogalacturonan acetylesterase [Bacillus sp. A301a_S52]|jgi:lysophospholipase L1-like esterase|nr:rhamnogalacturonan acetylesterase [Bacillus sp. A301a_S52]
MRRQLSYCFKKGYELKEDVLVLLSKTEHHQSYGWIKTPLVEEFLGMEALSLPGHYSMDSGFSFFTEVPKGQYVVTLYFQAGESQDVTVIFNEGQRLLKRKLEEKEMVYKVALRVEDRLFTIAVLPQLDRLVRLTIESQPTMPVIYLAGDSTVTDQPAARYPYSGWGQMLPLFLHPTIAVVNAAKSGRSSKSFIEEGRLNAIEKELKKGDYLFIQFGHNDEKTDKRGTDPDTTYPFYLRHYIQVALENEALPILITPVQRRTFNKDQTLKNTHSRYEKSMYQLSKEAGVPLIPLGKRSKYMIEKLGDEASKELFMWLDPGVYKGFLEGAKDNTHFTEKGAYEIAKLVATAIKESPLAGLVNYIDDLNY